MLDMSMSIDVMRMTILTDRLTREFTSNTCDGIGLESNRPHCPGVAMKTLVRSLLLLAMGAGVAGCAQGVKNDPATQLAELTKDRVAGKPQRCIDLSQAYDSQVIDKTTIAYRVGSTWYVNQLRSGADLLDSRNILVTRTIGSQLCELDNIRLVERYSGIPNGFVVLGPFVPYKKSPTPDH